MILDILIVSDVSGIVYLIENSFYYTLKSNLKASIKSEAKQPFFGFSSGHKQSSVAQLSYESHVIKEGETETKKLPFFSFGFFKSKPETQPAASPVEESKAKEPSRVVKTEASDKAGQKPSQPSGNRKRVQINKSDILSGNYSFTKPAADQPASEPKAKGKVDEDKINEILKRIERHTSKSSGQEERQSIGQLISDLKAVEKDNEETKEPPKAEETKQPKQETDKGDKQEETKKEATEKVDENKNEKETDNTKDTTKAEDTKESTENKAELKKENSKDNESNHSEDDAI